MPPGIRWRRLLARVAAGLLLVALAVGAFAATRPEEDPLPITTTTTTFPQAAYVAAMSASLRERLPVLDDPGSRCIAEALLTVLGPEALHALTDDADPLAALTPLQREQALRIVVTCLDPALAESLLGGGASVTQPPITLPTEDDP